jgi:hypothetical protein
MSSESTSELRRERDSIRVEMERVVRQMQSLEADLDAKRPGSDEKRAHLGQLRIQLSELRTRMRAVMDASSANDAVRARNSTTPVRALYTSNAAPSSGGAFGQVYPSADRSLQAPPSSYGATSAAANSAVSAQRADTALKQLQLRQDQEKELLDTEFARLSEQMRRRHASETEQLSQRLKAEAQRLQEYEEARLRMELARQELEALTAQPSILDDDSNLRNGPPELRALRSL